MDPSLHLQQKLENKLILTPQVKRSLEILQYPLKELEHFIREEALANPLIELKESNSVLEMALVQSKDGSIFAWNDDFDAISNIPYRNESIEIDLMQQLALVRSLTNTERGIVLYFIRSLDEFGYLDCEMAYTAEYFGVPVTKCEELLSVLQNFEPAGIGARSLSECLYLQAVRKGTVSRLVEILIQKHLEDLAQRKFQLLADVYAVSKEEVENAFSYIKQLNPRPLTEAKSSKQDSIIPDVIVEEFNGERIIQINDRHLPELTISRYCEELLQANADEETGAYLKTKLSEALLLMRGIEQRHKTLYKVTEIILQNQLAFFQKGRSALVPLRLKDVADSVGLHESTISRTISGKYIQTPRGTLMLKKFFVRGVQMHSGNVESPFYIKERIRTIIEKEGIDKPLSDRKIANHLLAEGIPIARRTVAKYREELGIPQSTKRGRKK